MIKPNKTRLMITLPINQEYFLRKLAKSKKMTLSKLISNLCAKNCEKLINEIEYEDYLNLLEIAHTRWLDE